MSVAPQHAITSTSPVEKRLGCSASLLHVGGGRHHRKHEQSVLDHAFHLVFALLSPHEPLHTYTYPYIRSTCIHTYICTRHGTTYTKTGQQHPQRNPKNTAEREEVKGRLHNTPHATTYQQGPAVVEVEVVRLPLPLFVALPLVEPREGHHAVPPPDQPPKRRLFRRLCINNNNNMRGGGVKQNRGDGTKNFGAVECRNLGGDGDGEEPRQQTATCTIDGSTTNSDHAQRCVRPPQPPPLVPARHPPFRSSR